MASWLDNLISGVNKLPGAGEINKLGSEASNAIGGFIQGQKVPGSNQTFGNLGSDISSDVSKAKSAISGVTGGGDPAPPNPAQSQLSNLVSGLTYGEIQNPSAQTVKQIANLIGDMPMQEAQKALASLPANSPLLSQVNQELGPAAASPSQSSLYGFDPLSMANIFQQSFAPFIQSNSQQLQGDISNYSKMMQQALKGASPQYQQAYAVSNPSLQQALSMENSAAAGAAVAGPEMDQIMQQLTNATNAAKSAGAIAGYEPYMASLISGSTLPSTAQPAATTPFTYGLPSQQTSNLASTQQALAQQNLLGLAQQAAQG